MKILVTGGGGFLGQAICKQLAAAGRVYPCYCTRREIRAVAGVRTNAVAPKGD